MKWSACAQVDPVLADAARLSGLSVDEVQDYLPKCLTVWMDPGEVSYRIGTALTQFLNLALVLVVAYTVEQ